MNVGSLISKLQSSDPDMLVGAYNDSTEEAQLIADCEIIENKNSHPYCKSDNLYELYNIKEGRKILLLTDKWLDTHTE